ncbi:MAG: 30S ribosomal protein S2 [Holosporales bacterium]|jgi:small subunit ribosomal protein S2|nr:30S ribosomal protein S2 [Holosporales bacterium]
MSVNFTMRQLLEAGVHYGHVTRKWNPKMAPYIFGKRNGIHIMDLEQTVPMLEMALNVAKDIITNYGRVLFVGTKPQASEIIKETAKKCGQYYVNHRWLGGMLTNWKTVSQSIKRLRSLEEQIENPMGLTKKEALYLQRKREKLELALGGIRDMGGLPDLVIIIDTIKESIAVSEARKLGIPIIAIIDSNSEPDNITYPIPGNDDATKAIELYCALFSSAILEGLQKGLEKSGVDIGATEPVAAAEISPEPKPELKEEIPAVEAQI